MGAALSRVHRRPAIVAPAAIIAVILFLVCGVAKSIAAERDNYHLMLDTGGHMALIKSVVFTPDGQHLVSASDDKTIRVWSVAEQRTVRIIRTLVGAGRVGALNAIALSPDGKVLATGGEFDVARGNSVGDIRLVDFETGALLSVLKGHTSAVTCLAFSPDGQRLASGSRDGTAAIWDLAAEPTLNRLIGHSKRVTSIGFSENAEHIVTGSSDQTVRIWDALNGRELRSLSGHTGEVRAVAVFPETDWVASGSWNDRFVRVWNRKTGELIKTIEVAGSSVESLAVVDRTRFVVSYAKDYNDLVLGVTEVFDVGSGSSLAKFQDTSVGTRATTVHPQTGLLAVAGSSFTNGISVLDLRTAERRALLAGSGTAKWAVGIADDGSAIAWGNTLAAWKQNNYGPLQHVIELPRAKSSLGQPVAMSPDEPRKFMAALTQQAGIRLELESSKEGRSRKWNMDILNAFRGSRRLSSINWKLVESDPFDGQRHQAFTLTQDGTRIVTGGANGVILAYTTAGALIGPYVGHAGYIWSLAVSSDDRYLVSASDDQTIALWNLATRELIVRAFLGTQGEWVVWTPQGYYMGSPGADRIVGWHINRADGTSEFIDASQLREQLHRPDIVERSILLASAEQARREAPGTSIKLDELLARPLPRFRITDVDVQRVTGTGRAQLSIAIDATPDPVKSVRLQVNGTNVTELVPDIESGGFKAGPMEVSVPLFKGRNIVRVTLTNEIGEKTETTEIVTAADGELDKRGTLYILAIGVNKYPALGDSCGPQGLSTCDLFGAGSDARLMAGALERRLRSQHVDVQSRVLVDDAADEKNRPTATNILDALDVLKRSKARDTVVVFIAGHGYNEGDSYRFLPGNAEWDGSSLRGSTVIPWQIFQEAIERTKGRRILFVDTCHAGNAYNRRLANAAYYSNVIAYTAARFDQLANEDPLVGNGLFTLAVVEALDDAKKMETKVRSTAELARYVIKRVQVMAKEIKREQQPVYLKGRDAEDYLLTD
jgi:WD40 repeat protein